MASKLTAKSTLSLERLARQSCEAQQQLSQGMLRLGSAAGGSTYPFEGISDSTAERIQDSWCTTHFLASDSEQSGVGVLMLSTRVSLQAAG